MSNFNNYNFNNVDAFLSTSEYYDFYLSQDEMGSPTSYTGLNLDCAVVRYDFNEPGMFETPKTIHSLSSWVGASNTGYTFSTFGLTGLDNGYLTFEKVSGDTCNTALLNGLTGNTTIASGDTRLVMNEVTGFTGDYIYPIEQLSGATEGDFARLCGGFYQGYYKLDGYSYEVLPN